MDMLTENFSADEFKCRCRRADCPRPEMNDDFMDLLQRVRDAWGKPMVITSGARCLCYNTIVGGSPNSQHLLGKAADIHLDRPEDINALADVAEKLGMGGIGRGVIGLLHLDSGAPGRRWTYSTK